MLSLLAQLSTPNIRNSVGDNITSSSRGLRSYLIFFVFCFPHPHSIDVTLQSLNIFFDCALVGHVDFSRVNTF